MQPTERVRACERSAIRVMYDLAEAADDDRDLVRLEIGEPDFDTPPHVTEAAFDAARGGATHYTTNIGLPELRATISDYLDRAFGVEADPEHVLTTTGGMEALHLAALCTCSPGSEVLIPSPSWPNYEIQARLADAVPVEVPMEYPFGLDADRVIERMGPDTDAVVLCTPSNPTGRVYDREAVRAVVEAAAEHDAYVFADEVYAALTYDHEPRGVAAVTGHPEHVLTIGSCSKSHAMTGWRVGWLTGDPDVVENAVTIREATTNCTPSISQRAAIEALSGDQSPFREMHDAFHERRDYVADRIDDMDGVHAPRPEGTFYAFLEPETDEASLPLAKRLLREEGLVLAPGSGFGKGGEGRLRLSFANSLDRLEEGLDRLERAL